MGEPVIPRLPVFGWSSFSGCRGAGIPCLLDGEHLVLTTSGRAALLLALEALGLGPGDRILLPSYHCPTMVAPAVELGATPVFYPLDVGGSPDLDRLRSTDMTGVKVLLAAHYFGLPIDMAALRDWCSVQGIALIEDCAHALFGVAGERSVGQWGDLAIGSLTKFYPVPEGGCLRYRPNDRPAALSRTPWVTELKALLDIAHTGAMFGRLHGLNTLIRGLFKLRRRLTQGKGARVPDDLPAGEPSSRDGMNIDTALAHRHLTLATSWMSRHLPRERIVAARRTHYLAYVDAFSGVPGLHPLRPVLPEQCAPYVFPLWVDEPDPGYLELRRDGVPLSRWNWLWAESSPQHGDNGARWAHHVLQVPCHQDLDVDERRRIQECLIGKYRRGPAA